MKFMKKAVFAILAMGMFLLNANSSFAQGTPILPFEDGKVLSSDDVNFLNYVVNGIGKTADSRGSASDVTIGGSMLKAGSKISKADADNIKKVLKSFEESDKMTSKSADGSPSRGADAYCGYCCYYYWWSNSCGCYYYSWYYCCAC